MTNPTGRMTEAEAKEIIKHPGIYCDKPDPLSHHQTFSIAKGFLQGIKIGEEKGKQLLDGTHAIGFREGVILEQKRSLRLFEALKDAKERVSLSNNSFDIETSENLEEAIKAYKESA